MKELQLILFGHAEDKINSIFFDVNPFLNMCHTLSTLTVLMYSCFLSDALSLTLLMSGPKGILPLT